MFPLILIIDKIFQILNILILLRVIISWLAPYSRNEFTNLVYMLTEPMLSPFRRFLTFGRMGIDLSPILAYFVLKMIHKLVLSILFIF